MKNKLSAKKVSTEKKPGLLNDGGGLYLKTGKAGNKSWVLRWRDRVKKNIRAMGLGAYPDVSLSEARELAGDARRIVEAGGDPIQQRKVEKAQQADALNTHIVADPDHMTFDMASKLFIDTRIAPEARNAKHLQQWRNTIRDYASPVFGNLPVNEITHHHVLAAVQPIWMSKTETAKRLRQRIERVLDWATTMEFRSGANPARWRGHLENLLPSPYKLIRGKIKHMPSMPYAEVPAFLERLRDKPGTGARALEFTILCAARSGEVRGCRWDEIDLDKKLWTIPGKRMKSGWEHKVPLSPAAVKILEALPQEEEIVFKAPRGGALSDMTLTKCMRDMEIKDAVVHGFRSSFKVWCQEETHYRDEISELALAHINSDETRAAYARSDLLDLRRELMEAWAEQCNPTPSTGKVVPINKALTN